MEPVELPDSANQEEEEEQMGRDEESDAPLIPGKSSATQIADFYDLLLSKLGVTFKLLLIVFCSGIGLLSDTLEIMSISFAKDDISKQFKLSRLEESTLAGVLFAGMLLGGLVWGRAADIYGRRRILLISLSMNGTCAALSALSTSFSMFLLARFFSGIGVGGSLPIIFSYVSEWVPRRLKGGIISAVATCWMVGAILAAALAWAVLPYPLQHPYWTAWRVYLLLCSIPSLLAVLLYFFLSESPVFLIQKGRNLQALEALRRFAPNSSDISQELGQLKRVLEDENMVTSASERLECHAVIKEFAMGVVELFSGGLLKITLILIAVILPVHFGYYGFMLWFPEYIKKQSNSSGEILSEDYVYRESLYVSLASLPGNLISVLLTDVVGPKLILCVSQVLSACSVFLLWKFNSPDQTVLLTCLFNAVTAPIFNMVDVLIPALYPTQSRGTAFGFHCALIRIVTIAGTSLFSMFIDSSPTAPILLTAILLFSSALVSLAVPKITSISH
ncbi:hypothetical protein ACHWQZ_G010842 [Mnemiopsis leidyi]